LPHNPPIHHGSPSRAPATRRDHISKRRRISFRSGACDLGEINKLDQHLPPSRCPRSGARQPTTTRAPFHRRLDSAHQPRSAAVASQAPIEAETRRRLPYLRPPAVGIRGVHNIAASVKTIPAPRSSTYTPRGGGREMRFPPPPSPVAPLGVEEGGGRGAMAARG
jgi:hypothetical protein